MGSNVLEEYLVKLGATQDTASFIKFNSTLKDASTSVDRFAEASVKSFAALNVAIVSAFASFGTSVISMADKTAMADQQFLLMGTRMLMTKNSFRAMQGALDTLGVTLSDVVTDGTGELNKEFQDLYERNVKLGKSLGTTFDPDMVGIRRLRIEVRQFGTELGFLAMGSVAKLYEKLGLGTGDVLADLRKLNDTFSDDLPMWADKVSTYLLPVWNDMKRTMGEVKDSAESVGLSFTNIVGILSGDKSIESSTFNIDNLAKALEHVSHAAADVASFSSKVLQQTAGAATGVSYLASYNVKMYQKGELEQKADKADEIGNKGAAEAYRSMANTKQREADADWNNFKATQAANLGSDPWGKNAPGGDLNDNGKFVNGMWIPGPLSLFSDIKPSISKSSDPIRQLADSVSSRLGVPASIIYSQWALETGGFTNRGAMNLNNLAGINVPGGRGEDYKDYPSLSSFGDDYVNQITKNYKGVIGASSSDQFAEGLNKGSSGSWFGAPTTLADYEKGLKSHAGDYDSGSSSTVNIQNFNVNLPAGTPQDHVKSIQEAFKELSKNQNRNVMAQTAGGTYQ
jgi:flagellum-specific peptidoglycan hydrolase FlgJ